MQGAPVRHAGCTGRDCQRAAGAPLVAWAVVDDDKLRVTGAVTSHNSSGDVQRQFCPDCGTGLFYSSESIFPGQVDVQSATFDDPDADRSEEPTSELTSLMRNSYTAICLKQKLANQTTT